VTVDTIKPPALDSGDKIAIVSPASNEAAERFDKAVERFREYGYYVEESIHARGRHYYFAGTDDERAEDFNRALRDESVKAIIASRGGYGSSRILDKIDYSTAARNPKIIVGGSDLTAILWAIHQKTGLTTFYGPMALQTGAGLDEFTRNSLWNTLRGKSAGEFKAPAGYNPYVIFPGKVRGKLIGGCLSLAATLLGTEYFGDVTGKILFLEEIGEKPFRIDRMLTHLRNAGVFDKIAGLMLGDFYKCWQEDDEESPTLPVMIKEIIGGRKIPVLAGLPFGHNDTKMTIPMGIETELDCDNCRLNFLEEGVSVDA
jgi:muramoyltetrapeptide carboxypeptidase